MLDFITEKIGMWEKLQKTQKPIVIYGMGDGADKILNVCENKNIKISAIFASDEYVRGHFFRGFKVQKYSQIQQDFPNHIVLVAFAVDYDEMLNKIYQISSQTETYAPHVPLFNDELFEPEFLNIYENQLKEVYDKLADDKSRQVFVNLLNFKISGKVEYLRDCTTDRVEDIECLLDINSSEVYVDLGAYRGDTVEEFLKICSNKYEKIIAVEPDKKSFAKLEEYVLENNIQNIELRNEGSWSEKTKLAFNNKAGRNSAISENGRIEIDVNSVDNMLNGISPTLIKMDVEGAELQTIEGAKMSISKSLPKLFVAAYHYDLDIIKIPQAIWAINPNYKIYLRRHKYIPAWETNIFAKIK